MIYSVAGATSLIQTLMKTLRFRPPPPRENINAFDTSVVALSEETMAAVDAVNMSGRDPCMVP